MTKKIILFLVEGPTDEDALALVYSKLVREHDLEFDVLHTDITAGEDMTVKYIADRIQAEVAEYLHKHPYIVKEDILKVVQIIDTDGAFIPTSQIRQSDTGKTEYFDTYIAAKNKDRLIRRNISKRRIVYHLMKSEEVADFHTKFITFPGTWSTYSMIFQRTWMTMRRKIWHTRLRCGTKTIRRNFFSFCMMTPSMYREPMEKPGSLSWKMENLLGDILTWRYFLKGWGSQ